MRSHLHQALSLTELQGSVRMTYAASTLIHDQLPPQHPVNTTRGWSYFIYICHKNLSRRRILHYRMQIFNQETELEDSTLETWLLKKKQHIL